MNVKEDEVEVAMQKCVAFIKDSEEVFRRLSMVRKGKVEVDRVV